MKNTDMYLERLSCNWSTDSIRCYNTPSPEARRLFLYVQEVGYFKTIPPYSTERANLHSFLILYTISGRGRLLYKGHEYILKEHQTFFIDCIQHHSYECVDLCKWEFLWVHFYGNSASGYCEYFSKNAFPIVTLEDSFYMESTLRRILALTIKKNIHSEMICSNLLTGIITECLINISTQALSLALMPDYIQNIVKYLDIHFKEEISLDCLCQQFGVSKFHLCREFKRYIGRSVTHYLIENRLNFAKELLRNSTLSISCISEQCGINHVSHFINLFKRKEGITPAVYRKEWR